MSCYGKGKDCEARRQMLREAIFQAKLSEALGHAVKGVAEIVGVKPKTGEAERKARKANPGESGNPAREGTNVNEEKL